MREETRRLLEDMIAHAKLQPSDDAPAAARAHWLSSAPVGFAVMTADTGAVRTHTGDGVYVGRGMSISAGSNMDAAFKGQIIPLVSTPSWKWPS